jgi:hypothetical protein
MQEQARLLNEREVGLSARAMGWSGRVHGETTSLDVPSLPGEGSASRPRSAWPAFVIDTSALLRLFLVDGSLPPALETAFAQGCYGETSRPCGP